VHMLELAESGGVPCGWILEIVARPDLLTRGGKVRRKATNLPLVVTTQRGM
jgi:hypothetical protein